MPQVREIVPYSKQHIYNLIRAGDFPAPIAISRNTVVWLEREVDKWVAQRVKERQRITGRGRSRSSPPNLGTACETTTAAHPA